ncbi:DNA-binding protein [Microbulbifer sp. DLAB2-AF]|uniref:DNA-binding protein n=1 Tax=Microbulbifer sp. DLAB2-AF TaxID=3243395 RepID=UPI00403A5604
MSYMIRGTIVGVKQVTKKDREGNAYSITYVGFESPKANGYQGETVITDIQVSRDQLNAGLPAYYEKLRGQEVLAPIWIQPWKNGGKFTTYFEGEGKCAPTSKPKAA